MSFSFLEKMETNKRSFSDQPSTSADTRGTISKGSLTMDVQSKDCPIDSEFSNGSESSRASTDPKVSAKRNIFDTYRQIGSELKLSLKAFENNNIYLSNKLSQLLQEIELQKRKRELQKRTLVDLQIKSEKLDQMKQFAVNECLSIKQRHIECLNKEFTTICENDQYLGETTGKIQQLLESDRLDVASFSNEVHQEYADQTKYCREYGEFIDRTHSAYIERIKNSLEEERSVDVELDEAIEQSKNTYGLKEKYEYEVQEKFSNLKLIEDEVEILRLKVIQCKKQLDEVAESNRCLNEESTENRRLQSMELSRKKEHVEELQIDVQVKSAELSQKEANLNEAINLHKTLLVQIKTAESKIEDGKAELADLKTQIDELNKNAVDGKSKLKELEEKVFDLGGVHKLEKELSSAKDVVLEKLSVKNRVVSDLEKKFAQLKDKKTKMENKYSSVKSAEDELNNKNDAAKRELDELIGGLSEVKDATKLKTLEGELEELKARSRNLKEQIEAAEAKLASATAEITQLEDENSLLDGELVEVSERESRVMKNLSYIDEERARLEELKKQISAVKDEVEKIKASREFQVNIDHLELEVKKVKQEIEEKNQQHETQKEAVESSFKKTFRNLQEQMEKLKDVSNEEIGRIKARTERYQNNIIQLQQDIAGCKSDLIQTVEKNIEMMKERLKVTTRLIERYRALQLKAQSTDGKDFTVMRLLGTIEEHLASSFRGMIEYLQMSPVDLSSPSYFVYRRTLDLFEKRFYTMISEGNMRLTDPAYLAELKNAAFCLFGLKRYSQAPPDSDSTFFSPNSSSILDY